VLANKLQGKYSIPANCDDTFLKKPDQNAEVLSKKATPSSAISGLPRRFRIRYPPGDDHDDIWRSPLKNHFKRVYQQVWKKGNLLAAAIENRKPIYHVSLQPQQLITSWCHFTFGP
jgi:hypothetical protein